ncbi:hypothetical protein EGW08_000949 [Elysia chlorotica]|uniref:Phosphatidylinositol-3,4,5-trisphosphate 3-phosphatase n=1 Tax=Elysia chlorotica TaxID=188477 RepID=A0A3S1A1B1_ELYCH|nr:hypothetical protein EGW08_000949 [Elysia chlorotica]
MSSTMRDLLNRSQEQTQVEGGALSLDVVYITERIISMTFPSEGHDTIYSFNLKEVVRMLQTKHGDNYLILNLSEQRNDLTKANPQVKDLGWPDHMAPPLERLCSLCKAVDSWLTQDPRNVAVLHCKGGRSRIASIIAAYMHYSNICASADQALDRFAMKRFYDDKLGGLPLPSQRRYVRYFSGLLSGAIKINSCPLYLHHILIHGVPNFDTKGGCRPFIKVYQGMQPIFTSGVYNVTDNMQKVCISISPGIPLRGDILIKCYHKRSRAGSREVMWQCQFHTCAISDNNIVFSKQELDDAVIDPRFPDNGKVEFVFGPSSDVLVSVSGFKSDVTVPVDDNEESLARSDSYENFNQAVDALSLTNRPNGNNQPRAVHVVTSQPSVTSPTSPVAYSSSSRLPQQQYPYQQPQQQQQQQHQQQHYQPHQQQQQAHLHTPRNTRPQTSPQPPPYSSISPRADSGIPGVGGVDLGGIDLGGVDLGGVSDRPGGRVEHQSAPDGSLYAVSRRVAGLSPSPSPSQPGRGYPHSGATSPQSQRSPMYQQQQQQHPYHNNYHQQQQQQLQPVLTNGSVNPNIEPGQTTSNYNSHYNSSSVASTSNTNLNNNHVVVHLVVVVVDHQQQQQQQQQSRKTVQTLEEKTQLDELLNDLLSPTEARPTAAAASPPALSPNSNNNNMLGASNKTVTTTTRTYTSYNTTDSHRNPDRVLIQRAEVSYKVPGQGEVKDHYTIAADPRDVLDTSGVAQSRQVTPKGVPTGAFSYLSGVQSSTNIHTSQSSQRSNVIEHEVTRSPAYRGQQASPPPPARPAYRPAEFDIPPPSKYSDSYGSAPAPPPAQPSSNQYSSLDSDANAWLAAQQQKLKNFKEGRDVTGRTVQEKNLVNELKFAQNKYYTRRTDSELEERVRHPHPHSHTQPHGHITTLPPSHLATCTQLET